MNHTELQLQALTAAPNEKKQGFLSVSHTDITLPVTMINGSRPGKTILLTAGIHGGEYTGIETLIQLAEEILPEALQGRLILVPIANPTAFRAITFWNVPEDGQNLNRMFPGKQNGTLSEQIAYTITHTLQGIADFYIDLHAGDLHEQLTPYVYFPGNAQPKVTEESQAAAAVLQVPYRVKSTAATGAYNSAALRGTPSLLIERGGLGQWSTTEVAEYKEDIYRLLAHLGVIDAPNPPVNLQQQEIAQAFYPCAQTDGLWYPHTSAGESIYAGQLLGEIKDPFGAVLEQIVAQADGVVLYQTVTLSIRKGDPTVAYGAF